MMYSKHENKEARPNTDNLDEYYSRHDGDRDGNMLASVSLLIIGGVLGMALLAGLRACDKEPGVVLNVTPCVTCHFLEAVAVKQSPVIKDLAAYKKAHPSPAGRRAQKARDEKRLLDDFVAELVRP